MLNNKELNYTDRLFETALWTNDEDVVIAVSPRHATRLMQKHCGCQGNYQHAHDEGQLWERLNNKQIVSIHGLEATAEEWCAAGTTGWLGTQRALGGYLKIKQANTQLTY